ncbi:dihydroxyacetone kinase subunit DhaK, partial [Streptomyces malaysiensis]|uniref:dihydroxyacetone kinase subunit DhaK n=1 Tax=Streptomyces malaysiensis TaxID=92644 RepID=UPI001F2A0B5A
MPQYFRDSPESLVPDALAGFAAAHADLVDYNPDHGYFHTRHTAPARRVGLVSGGGSGHEPLHSGFLGTGMLDAACPGRIFASPHNRQIFEASRAVARAEGVLHIVKNYTGDRINFGIAAERLAHEGIHCARVLIDDDLATDSDDIAVGRRGTGATLIVEKILGAAADEGRGLEDLVALGTDVTRGPYRTRPPAPRIPYGAPHPPRHHRTAPEGRRTPRRRWPMRSRSSTLARVTVLFTLLALLLPTGAAATAATAPGPLPVVTPRPQEMSRIGADVHVPDRVRLVIADGVDRPTRDLITSVLRRAGASRIQDGAGP